MRALRIGEVLVLVHLATAAVRKVEDKNYGLLRVDPHHPSLHFKRIGTLWSVRVGQHHRALGIDVREGVQWFWIGTHADYDRLIG